MKKPLLFLAPLLVVAVLGLTACGTTTPAATTPTTTPAVAKTAQVTRTNVAEQSMTIKDGLKLGSDGKIHDSFSPADLTVTQGVETKVTVYNYDTGDHDIVSAGLKLKVKIPASSKEGVPSVTTFTIKSDKIGDYHWLCDVTCDGGAKGWAMANDGFMAGKIHVIAPANQDQVAMTVLPGAKLGPDAKMHDIFSPADLNIVQGVPTKVTVYNYDTGAHDVVAKDLGINVKIPAATKEGQPSVTTFTITASKTGDFHWLCDVTCDGGAKGWAMAHDGFMAGMIHVTK